MQFRSALLVMSYIQNSLQTDSHTRLRWVFFLLVSAVLVIAFSLFFFALPDSFEKQTNQIQTAEAEETMEILHVREWVPEPPVRLVIPAIDVDAPIQYVRLNPDGTGEMDVPSNFTDVAWYKDGVRPGMRGSAVMAGHYNGKDIPEAVFYDLDTLEIGDEIIIESAERIEDIFQVVRVATYDYDDPTTEIFISTDGKKRLNLITCSGEWLPEEGQYNKRTVVFTELLTDVE